MHILNPAAFKMCIPSENEPLLNHGKNTIGFWFTEGEPLKWVKISVDPYVRPSVVHN